MHTHTAPSEYNLITIVQSNRARAVLSTLNAPRGRPTALCWSPLLSLARLMSVEVEPEVLAAFQRYDVDDSGAVDAHELRAALQELGLTVSGTQVEFMLRKYDDDRNATLQLREFAQLVRDMRINTPESVQRRLDLRSHPAVVDALEAWWSAAMQSMKVQCDASGPRPVEVGQLVHDQYVVVMRKISKALLEQWDVLEATAIAEEDWENDRRGHDFLDSELFKDGVFEWGRRRAHPGLPVVSLASGPSPRLLPPPPAPTSCHRLLPPPPASRLLPPASCHCLLPWHLPTMVFCIPHTGWQTCGRTPYRVTSTRSSCGRCSIRWRTVSRRMHTYGSPTR